MQTGQHIEVCQRFFDDALALDSRGSHMGAAEMIWGATVQALEALGHIRAGSTTRHLSRNARAETRAADWPNPLHSRECIDTTELRTNSTPTFTMVTSPPKSGMCKCG